MNAMTIVVDQKMTRRMVQQKENGRKELTGCKLYGFEMEDIQHVRVTCRGLEKVRDLETMKEAEGMEIEKSNSKHIV